MSREPPPPLPGGYRVGEQVYFTGCSLVFEDGDRLEHGQQVEVVGPALSDSYKGRGVAVLFPGNLTTECFPSEVRHRYYRTPGPSPATLGNPMTRSTASSPMSAIATTEPHRPNRPPYLTPGLCP